MLEGIAHRDLFQICERRVAWQDALRIAAKPLEKNGCVEPRYVEKIISITEECGPYYIIAPRLAIAHARPEDGANENALGLTLFRNPLAFPQSDFGDVELLFTFSTVENEGHVKMIQTMIRAFDQPDKVDRLLKAEGADELFACFFQNLES